MTLAADPNILLVMWWAVLGLYVWIAYDAYQKCKRGKR